MQPRGMLTNLSILKIVKEEGLKADAMSPGEIYVEEMAGFAPDDILYIIGLGSIFHIIHMKNELLHWQL